MSKQDGVAIRSASDLERKYQFGKQFEEVIGLVNDAREAAYKVESNLQNEILEQATSLTRDTESMIVTALKSYTTTSDLEELAKKLRAEFEVSAEQIRGQVSAVEDSVKNVDGDLQSKYNLITKYFTFDINGLLIGAVDEAGNPSPNKVVIDNDDITIMVNNTPILELKADGTGVIPILTISKQLKLCGLVTSEDDTHINCSYVG